MIARHETYTDKTDIWATLAAPLPAGVVSWRQDGKIAARDGRYFARFVAYIDANTVRERLDGVVPGEWDLTLDLLPSLPATDEDGNLCSFKARLQILGVIREDVGTGRDYKSAATDAFKRAAVRFGVAHELYAYEQNWVQMDGDGRYAKPLEDPQAAYVRRYGDPQAAVAETPAADTPVAIPQSAEPRVRRPRAGAAASARPEPEPTPALPEELRAADADTPSCPKCGGRMWDNRMSKRNPKAPDFKCRDRSCDGVVWPPRPAQPAGTTPERESAPPTGTDRSKNAVGPLVDVDESEVAVASADDDLPF